MARGGPAGVGGGFGEEGDELGGGVEGGVGGGLQIQLCLLWRRQEVHDPLARDEDPEELAGDFVDDFEAVALRGAEVEERVTEREVEEVAAGLGKFFVNGHCNGTSGGEARPGGVPVMLPALSRVVWLQWHLGRWCRFRLCPSSSQPRHGITVKGFGARASPWRWRNIPPWPVPVGRHCGPRGRFAPGTALDCLGPCRSTGC